MWGWRKTSSRQRLSVNSPRELEEERRLLYVAITRAKRHCTLTNAQNRWRFGQMQFDTPSRFLRDIPASLLSTDSGLQSASGNGFEASSAYGSSVSHGLNSGDRLQQWQHPKRISTPPPHSVTAATPRLRPLGHAQATPTTDSSALSKSCPVREGDQIEHQRFGRGRVLGIEGTGENTKITVEFSQMGVKQLLLKFAKFTVL